MASTLALILEANMLYTQRPFGWNKYEPSQLASKMKQHQETPGFFLIASGQAGLGVVHENTPRVEIYFHLLEIELELSLIFKH